MMWAMFYSFGFGKLEEIKTEKTQDQRSKTLTQQDGNKGHR